MPLCFAFPFMPMCAPKAHAECILKWMFCCPNQRFLILYDVEKVLCNQSLKRKRAAKNQIIMQMKEKKFQFRFCLTCFFSGCSFLIPYMKFVGRQTVFFSSKAILKRSIPINRESAVEIDYESVSVRCMLYRTDDSIESSRHTFYTCFFLLFASLGHFVTEFFSFFRFNYKFLNTDWIVNFWIELIWSYIPLI